MIAVATGLILLAGCSSILRNPVPEKYHQEVNVLGRDNLRFNLDTANQFVLKDNLALSLRRLVGHVDYIHLSDNRGLEVEHLVPGQGAINWLVFFETLDLIGFDGLIGLDLDIGGAESEVGNIDRAYIQSANWLTAHWRKIDRGK